VDPAALQRHLAPGPDTRHVVVLSRVIGCSPCHLDHRHLSPYGKACLRDIAPSEVRDAVLLVTARQAMAGRAGSMELSK